MPNIYSSTAALSALRAVNSINDALAASAERIATGRKIVSAKDNPTVWRAATTMESENRLAATVKDRLTYGAGMLAAAETGLNAASTALQGIRDVLVEALAVGADRAALQNEISGLQASLGDVAYEASMGSDLLHVDSASTQPVLSFVASMAGTGADMRVSTIDIDTRQTALVNDKAGESGILDATRSIGGTSASVLSIDISGLTSSALDLDTINDLIAIVDEAMGDVVTAGATVGMTQARMESQTRFLDSLMTTRANAVSDMVDVNLEEEAANKDALVVKQQLAIEALAIANSSMSSILRLFS